MKELYELKEKLCKELKEYGDKDMSAGSLDVVDKLSHTIKNLDKIIEKYEEDEYSGRMMPYSYDGNYAMASDRYSYTRGRGSNARRDSRGRYSSRGDGYSYHGDMISELHELMEDAPDERTKQEFKRFISKIESM
ncbi:MAG TPA: hypothetical protein DHV37_05865 [Erysipelotrichaceae bacterium]|nr:hypothetical protein [Erysipelotrichaceae bacterium]